MKLNFEKQTVLAVIVFAAVGSAVIGGVIFPTMNYIKRLNKETDDLKTYMEKKYENSMHMRVAIRKVTEVQNTAKNYPNHLYRTGDELNLITTLENIAAKNKVQQKFSSSNLDHPNIKKIELAMNISGDYINVLNYLSDIEAARYFFNTEKIQITTSGSKPGAPTSAGQANLYLELSLYVNQ